jgi:GNAT superfamily N-acetyltransferase
MSIQIRPAKSEDMAACAALYKEIYNTTYQGVVDSRLVTSINQEDTVQRMRGNWLQPGAEFVIAEEIDEAGNTTFLGFSSGRPSPDVLGAFWLEMLFLCETARGKGLGRKLINHMGNVARSQGYNQMVIDVFAGNDNAEAMYRYLGAELINDNYMEEINLFPVKAKLLLWEDLECFA